jgi:beta-hydroxylase
MPYPVVIKTLLIAIFLGSVLFVHFRGRARLPLLRQMFNYSALFTPYNSLMYLFSKTPSRPYLQRRDFPELDLLRDNWQVIRDEAMALFDEGHIRAALNDNEAGFGSFFKKGWKRFYLSWYDDGPLPSARALCPRTLELLNQVPSVRGAMFALLPGGSHLNPHRDPFAGSLRYHLGLSTPNSDACRIYVDGQVYAWRDGEDVMFDETYVHWVKNETPTTRVILFCDVERPLPAPLRQINRWISGVLGRATAPQNMEGERVGVINRAYGRIKRGGNVFGAHFKQFKRRHRQAYQVLRVILLLAVVLGLWRWLIG